jgi:hypothetical protein
MVAGRRGAAFYGTTAVSTPPADEPDTNWLVMCGTNDPSTQAPSNVIYEQNEIGARNGGTGSCALHVNKYRALASPFALHSVLIWDKGLSPEQMKTVTRELQGQIQSRNIENHHAAVILVRSDPVSKRSGCPKRSLRQAVSSVARPGCSTRLTPSA